MKSYSATLSALALAVASTACGGADVSPSSQDETSAKSGSATVASAAATPISATTTAAVNPIRHAFDSAPVSIVTPGAPHVAAVRPLIGGSQPIPPAVDGFVRRDGGGYVLPKHHHPRHPVTVALGSAPTLSYDAGLASPVVISHGGLDGQPGTVTEEPDGAISVSSDDSARVVFFVPSEDGVEDFTFVPEQPTAESMNLQLSVPAGAGLRLVNGELALLDASGTPRIRLAPPRIYFGDGDSSLGAVSLPDCDHDTSPEAPWGSRDHAGQRARHRRDLHGDPPLGRHRGDLSGAGRPLVTSAGNMATARWAHTATLLSSGRVLVAGGVTGGTPLASAELYDPTSNTWAATGSLHVARASQTATILGSGATVLVAGGDDNGQALSSCEVYSVSTGTWTTTAAMATTRDFHNAWALDSTHVMVAGGASWTSSTWNVLGTAAIYTSTTGTWAATGSLYTARVFSASTTTAAGAPLIVGGDNGTAVLATSETYSILLSTWLVTLGPLTTARENAVMMVTSSGTTVFGGTDFNGDALASTET